MGHDAIVCIGEGSIKERKSSLACSTKELAIRSEMTNLPLSTGLHLVPAELGCGCRGSLGLCAEVSRGMSIDGTNPYLVGSLLCLGSLLLLLSSGESGLACCCSDFGLLGCNCELRERVCQWAITRRNRPLQIRLTSLSVDLLHAETGDSSLVLYGSPGALLCDLLADSLSVYSAVDLGPCELSGILPLQE